MMITLLLKRYYTGMSRNQFRMLFGSIILLAGLALFIPAGVYAQQAELLHYWNFNDAENPSDPSFTVGGAAFEVSLEEGSGLLFDTGQDFAGANARFGDEAGAHLRLNNPIGSELVFRLPTTGMENVVVRYETRRSGQGAGIQNVSYTLDGEQWEFFAEVITFNAPPALQTLDFSEVEGVNNNPDFAIRFAFEQGDGGTGGNNRFDNLTVESFEDVPERALVHYWNFNDTGNLTEASFSLGGAALDIELGADTEVVAGTGQDFAAANARFGDEAGAHLRVNNPLGASMLFSLPTTGYENILLKYETRRSGQGAGTQEIYYTTDGEQFELFTTITLFDAPPVLHEFNFSSDTLAADNPAFAVLIRFEQGEGGTAGNNRFDNVTLEGSALESTNTPPFAGPVPDLMQLIASDDTLDIDLSEIFTDPDGDPLTYAAEGTRDAVADLTILNGTLSILPEFQGESVVTVTASDGFNPPVPVSFRVLVHPATHTLIIPNGEGGAGMANPFEFREWDPMEPAGSFPPNMIFMQSDMDDPGLEDPLMFAYDVPESDYQSDDLALLGFPYALTRRTRMNGLGEGGISFINTGRGRDLGAAVVALDTRDAQQVTVRWTGGTVLPNSRVYNIRLQFRAGIDEAFQDLLSGGEPVEYVRNETGGHAIDFPAVELPEELLGLPYVQLKWKYYFTGERLSMESGARDQLRIADIVIDPTPPTSIGQNPDIAGRFRLEPNYPNPFNPETRIRFEIPEASAVRLEVFNILGERLATLVDQQLQAGEHSARFDASHLGSGVYMYRLSSGAGVLSGKMILVK